MPMETQTNLGENQNQTPEKQSSTFLRILPNMHQNCLNFSSPFIKIRGFFAFFLSGSLF